MKLKLSSFVSAIFLMSSISSTIAQDQVDMEYKSMEQMVGAIRLEKRQVEGMIDKMVSSGRITAEEGMNVKREMASMKDSDLEDLKMRAIAEIKNKK